MRSTQGFTLTELLVVIAILGMLASGSMFVLSGFVRRAESLTSWEAIKNLIQWARVHSETEQVRLVFDFDEQLVEVFAVATKRTRRHRIQGDLSMIACMIGNEQLQRGKLEIDFEEGMGQTFAIRIQVQSGERRRERWLLVCGLSGEIYEFDNENRLSKALQAWVSASS